MNEQSLIDAIENISSDKSLQQPWKNMALSDMRRGLACLKMASGSMFHLEQKRPQRGSDGFKVNDSTRTPIPNFEACICKPGTLNSLCLSERHNS